MNVSGSLAIAALPVKVLAKLQDKQIWEALLPHCTGVEETAPGALVAKISFMAGPVPIRTDARIKVAETAQRARQIKIEGGSFVTGHATLNLEITAQKTDAGTDLSYTGTLITSGLLKRMVAGKEQRLGPRAEALFARFKDRVERPGGLKKTA